MPHPSELSQISDGIRRAGEEGWRKLNRIKPVTNKFARADQLLLDIQEALCSKKLTHRADQVDILRRALNLVISETQFEVRLAK